MKKPLILISSAFHEDGSLNLSPLYGKAVALAGGIPVIVNGGSAEDYAAHFDALILTGGEDVEPSRYGRKPKTDTLKCNPARDEIEFNLLRAFAAERKPVFGICRGEQLIAAYFGGKLYQNIPDVLPEPHGREENGIPRHGIHACPDSILAPLFGENFTVNSYHHQAVENLRSGSVKASAFSDDGVIEAIEHISLPIFGVQWHPERMIGDPDFPDMLPLFCHLISLCSQ